MVEDLRTEYPIAQRLLRFFSLMMAGGILAQTIACLMAYLLLTDAQAASMLAQLITQHLSYYFLGCTFAILSLTNVLVKRGVTSLKPIRLPCLFLLLTIASASFLLTPRMDYLRETALLDGIPVMLSPMAKYFFILNMLWSVLLLLQILISVLLAWRLSTVKSA